MATRNIERVVDVIVVVLNYINCINRVWCVLKSVIYVNRYIGEMVTGIWHSYFWTGRHRKFVYSKKVI